MSRRANAYVAMALLGLGGALVVPEIGWASSGGAAPPPSGGQGLGGTPPPPSPHVSSNTAVVQPGDVTVTATGNGITVAARASTMLSNDLRFSGSVPRSAAGEIVEVERLGRQTHWLWAPTAHSIVQANGSFTAVWPANHIGRFTIRAVLEAPTGASARAGVSSPTLTVTVYRTAIATQYGPGFYGSRTACGQILTPKMLGTANRTLKCGTPVAIYYQGRTIVVPVIDRGPFANGADWDLTEATGRALGIDGTATIGAVSLPHK